jgi:hypothetical protein
VGCVYVYFRLFFFCQYNDTQFSCVFEKKIFVSSNKFVKKTRFEYLYDDINFVPLMLIYFIYI